MRGSIADADAQGCAKLLGVSITFDAIATLHRDRRHFCSPARPVKIP
jgi:hypothetical protein